MKNKLLHIIRTKPVFLYLLPVFFVLHGFAENYDLIPVKNAVILVLVYSGVAFILSLLFWLLYRNFLKANLMAFLLLSYQFFYGSVHNFLKDNFAGSFIAKYSFILPFTIVVLTIIVIYIKKTKAAFTATTKYLNWLFLLLIFIDTGTLLLKLNKKTKEPVVNLSKYFSDCDTCSKPDIYLILADEYAGQTELQDIFGFDNSPFLDELKKRNYHVVANSRGNYNFTHYAMASMFDMDYLPGISGNHSSRHDLSISFNTLKKSKALQYFLNQGYEFYNYSVFDFKHHPSPATPSFIPRKTIPITSQTFLYRLRRDLGYHLITTLKLKSAISKLYYTDLYNNEKIYELTMAIGAKKTTNPKFVYTHLVMPHYRYYFDSKGQPAPFEKITDDNYCTDKSAYTEYLQYTNGKLLALIDNIAKSAEKPPVIILLSDHGYHQFTGKEADTIDKKYYFMTLNAVYFPGGNYSAFYDSMSNVNQFRVILNSLFRQQLPLLKDSTILLAQ